MTLKSKLTVAVVVFLTVALFCVYTLQERTLLEPTYPQLTTLAHVDTQVPFQVSKDLNKNRPVVLCFFCGCDNCRMTAKRLTSLTRHAKRNNSNILGVFSIGPQDTRDFVRTTGFPGKPLLDNNSAVAEHYKATLCPRIFVLQGTTVLYSSPQGGKPLSEGELQQVAKYL